MAETPNYEAIYHELGALLAEAPSLNFDIRTGCPPDVVKWLGQVSALINRTDDVRDYVPFDITAEFVVSGMGSRSKLMLILHRVMAKLEAHLPAQSKGAFVVAGNQLDAFSALAKLLGGATKDVMIVDPYMDETALVDFSVLVPERVTVNLLASEDSVKPGLEPAARRWIAQYADARPLSVRLAAPRSLHDRLIFIDGANAYILTQSLKDFAKRSHASIQRVAPETAAMKTGAYNDIWKTAAIIAETP